MTSLCLDFGNTRQKAAIFEDGELIKTIYLAQDLEASVAEIYDGYRPEVSILSSVIHHPVAVEIFLKDHTHFHLLAAATSKLNFTTPVGKPETIGADRLALCAAAVLANPNENNLVIGLGTCVTYNYINVKNEFLGGGISPGMYMRMHAMHAHTALLPIVSPDWNVPLVGYDTKTNIQSGVVLGMAMEIDGFVKAYETKYKDLKVLLTGGDAQHLSPHLKSNITIDENLLFKGLYAIRTINN
jgi:type III pantothenate kinase